jgi:hypothetical protein
MNHRWIQINTDEEASWPETSGDIAYVVWLTAG